MPKIVETCEPILCCDTVWEEAYARFETEAAERAKFRRRLMHLGAASWPKSARVVELFCGRGNGLEALKELGFHNTIGVDLSKRLLMQYEGESPLYVADCRSLPFDNAYFDIVIVQGGLHHLPTLPDDLIAVLRESQRVLVDGGRMIIVEPWMTLFLRFVHLVSFNRIMRRLSGRLDAFATMVEREQTTYFQWLNTPASILSSLNDVFATEQQVVGWGKLMYVGVNR